MKIHLKACNEKREKEKERDGESREKATAKAHRQSQRLVQKINSYIFVINFPMNT